MSLLKKQIVSFENAEKLKELGFHQESLFYYVNNYVERNGNEIDNGQYIITGEKKHLIKVNSRKSGTEVEFVSAYTLAEILRFTNYSFYTSNLAANNVAIYLVDLLNGFSESFVNTYNRTYREYFKLEDECPSCEYATNNSGIIRIKVVECSNCKNKEL